MAKSRVKMAENNMKILSSGKVKIKKGTVLDLNSLIGSSASDAIVSRLDGIISKEGVTKDPDNFETSELMVSQMKALEITSRVSKDTYTCIIPMTRKKSLDDFNFIDNTIVGELLRTSNLAKIYTKLKPQWKELNSGTDGLINVMYIPKVKVFIDHHLGDILNRPFDVNVLFVSLPSKKAALQQNKGMDENELTEFYIASILEAGIRCGVSHAIIDPYRIKAFNKSIGETGEAWGRALASDRIKTTYSKIITSFEEEDKWVTYSRRVIDIISKLKGLVSDNNDSIVSKNRKRK